MRSGGSNGTGLIGLCSTPETLTLPIDALMLSSRGVFAVCSVVEVFEAFDASGEGILDAVELQLALSAAAPGTSLERGALS
eukprot:1293052-Amphidinium_carterae.1